ncbi:MAG: long-chain fatty acid--CoA ligase [Bacteroidales bacterium]|nr:long-chain fatty acid--CoA ligase [Bacteroidales bacterium]MCF8406067.1 long-chain fatty acid--CoA ligase [Bacteroidales bacterium]
MNVTRTFDLLDRYISEFSDKPALSAKENGKWVEYSPQQYNEFAHFFAYGLLEMGFKKGDKIITITNNRPEWNFVDLGMAMIGVIHVPTFTSLNPEEYKYIIAHSDARMIILSDIHLFEMINPIFTDIKTVEYLFSFNDIKDVPNWKEVLEKGKNCRKDCIERAEEIRLEIKPDDLASIMYTSGTTGKPKGVMLSHKNLVQNFIAASMIFKLTPEDKFLSILPLCHVGGRMGNYQTQYSGACIYYCENMGTIASNLREIKASGFDAVPRILEKIYDTVIAKGSSLKGVKKKLFFWAVKMGLQYQPFGRKSWLYYKKLKIADKLIFTKWREALGGNARIVGCGGASLQPRLERVFWASGLKILNMYGLTETSPIITINGQEKEICRLGSVGAIIDGVEVKIAGDGEILCKGHNVMLGYYKDEALTNSVLDEDGWFHTGDIGELEDGKFLSIKDRKKEIFKLSNGKYVAPQVIENRLKESEFIDQVMVIGEHQKFASALLVPNFEYLKTWCADKSFYSKQNSEDIITIPEVLNVFNKEILKINKHLSAHERIQRIRLISDVWSPQSGELSASLKMKRKFIELKYQEVLSGIYKKKELF